MIIPRSVRILGKRLYKAVIEKYGVEYKKKALELLSSMIFSK